MKNNILKRFVLLSTAALLLLIVLLYLGIPSFSVSVNRTFEMIKTGSTKGLMMIFYQFRPYELIFAGFTIVVQKLTLVFPVMPIIRACDEYFKENIGAVVLFLGSLISLGIGYSIGYMLRFALKKGLKRITLFKKTLKKKGIVEGLILLVAFLVGALNFYWVGAIFYITGFLEVDLKKLLFVFSVAFLIVNWSI